MRSLFKGVPRHDPGGERVWPNQVRWFAALMGLCLTFGVPHCEERLGSRTLPGAALSRCVAAVDYGTLRRYRGLWVRLETGTRGLVRFRSGRFDDTARWECGAVVLCRVGLPTVGTLRRYHPLGRD